MDNIKNESSLLIHKRPDLVKEWDFEKNIGIDINSITFASHKAVYWKCLKNTNHESYKTEVFVRTSKRKNKNGTIGSACRQCSIDSRRKYEKEELETVRNRKPLRENSTYIGDETEAYVQNLLKETQKFKNVEIVGNLGGKGDICIESFDNNVNYIQVKTLIHIKEEKYSIQNKFQYDDNMLLVPVNKDRNKFALEFAKNIKVKTLGLFFDSKKSKYKNIMYTDLNLFLKKLIELIPLSCSENYINEDINKEISMLKRFEKYCEDNHIDYLRNSTNGNTIDGTINGKTFQAKFTSENNANSMTYRINFKKHAGCIGNRNITKSYEEGDFDFLIIEVGGTKENPDKYKGNFCIIPSEKLIEIKAFKNENDKGKLSLSICPPDYKRDHWTKKYWNNIDIFNTK